MSMFPDGLAFCLLACLAAGFGGGSAWALTGDIASTCRAGIARPDLESLALDPRPLLNRYPDGGPRLAWRTLAIATAGPMGLRTLARAMAIANIPQKRAIGEGLARAAADCDGHDSAVTTQIADLVRDGADAEVLRAFTKQLAGDEEGPRAAPSRDPAAALPTGASGRLGLDDVGLSDR